MMGGTTQKVTLAPTSPRPKKLAWRQVFGDVAISPNYGGGESWRDRLLLHFSDITLTPIKSGWE